MGQLTTVLLIIILLPKTYSKFGPKGQSMTTLCMFRATNLRQSREFYTNAIGDFGDISKVCKHHSMSLLVALNTIV